jgi:hypothetical protein
MFAYKEVNNICGVSIIIDFIKIKNWWIEVNDRYLCQRVGLEQSGSNHHLIEN